MVHNGFGSSFQHSDKAQPIEYLDTLFKSAIIAPAATRATPLDPWGNVKVPRIEQYENNASPDDDGWFDVGAGNTSIYTSLIGIPMAGADSSAYINYSTTIHTPYLNVNCALNSSIDLDWVRTHPPDRTRFQNSSGISALIFAEQSRQRVKLTDLRPYQFSYVTLSFEDDFKLDCNVTNSYVESRLVCPHVSDCKIDKIRRSLLNHLPENWTMLDIHYNNPSMAFGSFIRSFGGDGNAATLLDRYLSDPTLDVSDKTMYRVNRTTEVNYSLRFMQLLNSYFTGMNSLYAITGGLNNDTAYYWDNETSFVPEVSTNNLTIAAYNTTDYAGIYNWTGESKKARVWQSEGLRCTVTEILIANKPWVATLAFVSIVLIAASLVSPLIHCFLINGPEVMMNISSLATRHNPHVPLPDDGSFMEASDRARLLKNVRIRYGDIEGQAGVGRLVIGVPRNLDGQAIGKIQQGRLYR